MKPITATAVSTEPFIASQRQRLMASGIVILGAVLFSTKAIMVKLALPYGVSPVSLLMLRMLFSLPFYVAILAWVKSRASRPLGIASSAVPIFGLGFVGYYLASYFDFVGLAYISAGLERVILYSYPTLVLLMSAIVLKKQIHIQQVVAIILCYVGIFVALWSGVEQSVDGNFWLGAGLIFLSAVAFAAYVVGSGQLIPRLGVVVFTSCAMIVSTVCVSVHYFLANADVHLLAHAWPVYGYGLAMAVFATVLPSFLISEGIKRIGATNASIVGGIGPISTIVLATAFLGERFTVAQMAGTILVIAGVLYISVSSRQ